MLNRALSWVMIIFLVYVLSRALIHALPGDPIETLIAETGTRIPVEELRRQLGLDRPFAASLLQDLKGILVGDWGRSILSGQPIAPLLAERFERTFVLTISALAAGLLASLLIGLPAAASRAGKTQSQLARLADRFCSRYGALAAALPTPWIGPIFIYFFAVLLPLFPLGGNLWLPTLTLAFGFSGLWARLIRERVTESLIRGAADGARARGVAEWKVALKYGLAPVAGALAAYLGTQVGGLLTGAFVTEMVFNWPGMGTLMVDAVLARDYPVVQATAFAGAALALTGNVLGDALRSWIDPRSRDRTGGRARA